MNDEDYLTLCLNEWCARYLTDKAVWQDMAFPEEIRAEAGSRASRALRCAKDAVILRRYARKRDRG